MVFSNMSKYSCKLRNQKLTSLLVTNDPLRVATLAPSSSSDATCSQQSCDLWDFDPSNCNECSENRWNSCPGSNISVDLHFYIWVQTKPWHPSTELFLVPTKPVGVTQFYLTPPSLTHFTLIDVWRTEVWHDKVSQGPRNQVVFHACHTLQFQYQTATLVA